MGVFNWPVTLGSMVGERSLELGALVDTGASYTIVPASRLRDSGVTPIDKIGLVLADGRPVEYNMWRSHCHGQREAYSNPGSLRGG